MEYKSRRSSTVRQLELLVDFLREHKDLALGRVRSKEARAMASRLWGECALILNAEGPARTPREWARFWNDFKCRVRSKIDNNTKTNGEGLSLLTPIEDRVAKLMGRQNSTFTGKSCFDEKKFGISDTPESRTPASSEPSSRLSSANEIFLESFPIIEDEHNSDGDSTTVRQSRRNKMQISRRMTIQRRGWPPPRSKSVLAGFRTAIARIEHMRARTEYKLAETALKQADATFKHAEAMSVLAQSFALIAKSIDRLSRDRTNDHTRKTEQE